MALRRPEISRWLCFLTLLKVGACSRPDAGDVAQRVTDAIVAQNETFFPCDMYGAALMQQALWEGNAAFPDVMDTRLLLSTHLDACAAQPGTSAYVILNHQNVNLQLFQILLVT